MERPTDNGGKFRGSATIDRQGLSGAGMRFDTPVGKNGHFNMGA